MTIELIVACISLYITNTFICTLVFNINVCIWNIIISELKDNINEIIHNRGVVFNDVLDNILIPLVSSNNPITIPLIVSFILIVLNNMFGISGNIIVYPKIIPNVLKEFSIEVDNIFP